jgi:hypothetical protein
MLQDWGQLLDADLSPRVVPDQTSIDGLLESISTPVAGKVEIHQMTIENGVMRMRQAHDRRKAERTPITKEPVSTGPQPP